MEVGAGLSGHLRQFDVDVPLGCDFPSWLAARLMECPAATASLSGMSAQLNAVPGRTFAVVSTSYSPVSSNSPVFIARDTFELACSISLALRKHLDVLRIVVDNSSGFTSARHLPHKMRGLVGSVGEDILRSQSSGALSTCSTLCSGKVLVYTMEAAYFESKQTFDSLVCVIGEHAAAAEERVGWEGRALANELMQWMRENVSYMDTGELADHSAAALIRTGHAVCQGIAAYANQFLWACGIPSRYVSGTLDGGRHAWNVAKIDGRWVHLDYTFAIAEPQMCDITAVSPRRFSCGRDWDMEEFSSGRNEYVCGIRQALLGSTITMTPESDCHSVNGCVVDTSQSARICIVRDGVVLVSAGDLGQVFGGGAARRGDMLRLVHGSRLNDVSLRDVVSESGRDYIPVKLLSRLGFRISIDGEENSIRPFDPLSPRSATLHSSPSWTDDTKVPAGILVTT